MISTRTTLVTSALATAALLLASCAESDTAEANPTSPPSTASTSPETHDHNHDDDTTTDVAREATQEAAQEVSAPQPRIVTTYDGGILTLDANTLEVLDNTELAGFNRLNSAGDGRHVFVSTGAGFQLLDAGAWTEPHGAHTHSYTAPPGLTDITYATDKPGHVVVNAGKTVLFGDGDGKIQILDTAELPGSDNAEPSIVSLPDPHHGVAVALDNDQLLHTLGDSDSRNGAIVLDATGQEIARNEQCAGLHGEAAAQGGAIALGCEDGVLVYRNGEFTKVQAPDSYGRIGNQAGSDASPVILGDYKVDKEATLERPRRISLTNTETGDLKLVELGTSYSFRSLGRGADGEAVVLGTDGQLHIINPDTGDILNTYPVIEEWTESEKWQEARPTLFIQEDLAYVSEPSKNKLHMVDLNTGDILRSAELPETPNELSGVTG